VAGEKPSRVAEGLAEGRPWFLIMATELTGRSAILKRDIERLEQEHQFLCMQIGDSQG
jgi:uncharacterized small protein (DUF1192 family)